MVDSRCAARGMDAHQDLIFNSSLNTRGHVEHQVIFNLHATKHTAECVRSLSDLDAGILAGFADREILDTLNE